MKRLILLLFATCALAQPSLVILLSSTTVHPGGTVTLTWNYADSTPTSGVVVIQWESLIPVGWTMAAPIAGPGDVVSSKTLSCSTITGICAVTGLNTTVLATGIIATAVLTAPATVSAGSYAVSMSNVVGASTTGTTVTSVPVNSSPALTLTVTSRFDINGDGVVSAADMTAWLANFTAAGACTSTYDLTGRAKCDVADALELILAIMGKISL